MRACAHGLSAKTVILIKKTWFLSIWGNMTEMENGRSSWYAQLSSSGLWCLLKTKGSDLRAFIECGDFFFHQQNLIGTRHWAVGFLCESVVKTSQSLASQKLRAGGQSRATLICQICWHAEHGCTVMITHQLSQFSVQYVYHTFWYCDRIKTLYARRNDILFSSS